MPALFAPALDLAALMAVLVALALVYLAYKLAQSIAGILNFSILGIHPLANVSRALENSIVTWLSSAVTDLEIVARDLFHGLTWAWGEFLDGINAMTTHVEDAFSLLWNTSIPIYVKAAIRPIALMADAALATAQAASRTIAREVDRLDAKIEQTARATAQTVTRDVTQQLTRDTAGIEADIRGVKSSVDQAIDHALNLARAESQQALGELRNAEDAALGAVRGTFDATTDELRDQIRSLNPTELAGLLAAVPLLAEFVRAVTAESGLDNAACRNKVKGICGTDAGDWSWLLAGAGGIGFGLSLAEIVEAGREVARYVVNGAEDLADLG